MRCPLLARVPLPPVVIACCALVLFVLAMLFGGGCGPIGQRITDNASGGAVENGSPNTLVGQDGESSGTVNSPGPVRELVIGPAGVRTRQGGTAPAEGFIRRDDSGVQFAFSAAANASGSGVRVMDGAGNVLFEADALSVDGASQIRALNESLDRLVQYWPQRDALTVEQARVVRDTIAEVGRSLPSLAALLAELFAGGPK